MLETSNTNNDAELFDTPGLLLRTQREKQGLSAQEIAKRTHLDIKIVELIEQDSDEGMPAATYVRGYLRSYAKIVGVDPDHIITLYNSDSPQPPPEILPEVKQPSQVSSSDKPVKAFTYLITLGLVLLLLIWYQSNFVVDTSIINEPENYNSQTSINGVDITYDVVKHPSSWQSPKNITAPEPASPESANHNDSLELQSDNGEQTLGILPIERIDNKTTSSASGSGPDTIDLEVKRDSWIEIKDANDQKLFHDLALGGEKYSIHGTAPFNVLFGFSPGVTIKFNGKAFNHSRYSNNGIARFKLPEQQ
ncbi:MAG: transcriptional regulator [marine bacterium B5-7]|nr:MAG: transcriptional regulator [marine bacterium B5-7]